MNALPQLRAGLRSASGPFWRAVGWNGATPRDETKTTSRNIGRFKRQLVTENDPKKRETIIRLLSQEEAHLRRITRAWM